MKKPDKLFQLVKTLTKSEKRYFKLLASLQKGSKQYLRLFDAIDAQDEYDEAALTEQFAGERLLRQFNVAKNYLYELLLRSLRTYHAQHGTEARILEMLRTIIVLYERGLEEQALEVAEKAVRLAERHEEFALLVRANAWKQRITAQLDFSKNQLKEYYAEQYRALDQQRELLEQAHLLDVTVLQMLVGSDEFSSEERAELEERLQNADQNTNSVKAGLLLNWTYDTYHYARGDMQTALYYTGRQRHLLESHPAILYDYPVKYFYVLSNQALASRHLGDEARFHEILNEAQEIARLMLAEYPWRSHHIRLSIFQAVWWNQFCYFAKSGEFNQARSLARTIEKELPAYAPLINPFERANMKVKLAGTFLAEGDPCHALSLLDSLLNDDNDVAGTLLQSQVRFIAIIAHFELGHTGLIEYVVRSAYRALRSRGPLGRFESVMLRRLKKLADTNPNRPDIPLFKKWHQELLQLEQEEEGSVPAGHFEYLLWVESKVEGCNLVTLVQQRYHAGALLPQ